MRRYCRLVGLSLGFSLLLSCEDVIDVGLNDAEPQLVVSASVNNKDNVQVVMIARTVPFSSDEPFDGVSGVRVQMQEISGGHAGIRTFDFEETTPGRYEAQNFMGVPGAGYSLSVLTDDLHLTATAVMSSPIRIDSIGTGIRRLFGEEERFVQIKYQDPPGVPNYYRFLWSINGAPFEMLHVSRDKFNDGKYVSEDLFDPDVDLKEGDSVIIKVECIDEQTFNFWNVVQSMNPGTAAPANPPSVFGNQVLGYFSAHSVTEVSTAVQ
jgi:hypothetical protein